MALSHAKLHRLLPSLLLGSLGASDERRLRKHLAQGCPVCEAEWRRLRASAPRMLEAMAQAAPKSEPPASVKAGLLGLIRRPALRISELSGSALCQGRSIEKPGDIKSNDAIECLSGEIELQAPGQSSLKLLPGSLARLSRKASGLELLIERGAALIHVVSGQPFLARLPLGEIRVKGTYFYAEARGAKESYVCLCEGWVDLSAPGFHQEMKAEDHQALVLKSRQGQISASPASDGHPEFELGKP